MAHELTHTVQQGKSGAVQRQVVQRDEEGDEVDAAATRRRAEAALEDSVRNLEELRRAYNQTEDPGERGAYYLAMEKLRVAAANLAQELEAARTGGVSGAEVAASFAVAGALLFTPIPFVDEGAGFAVAVVQTVRWILTLLRVIGTGIAVGTALVGAISTLEQINREAQNILHKQDKDLGIKDRNFWRWWHREKQKMHEGDIDSREEAEERFREWENLGRPGPGKG